MSEMIPNEDMDKIHVLLIEETNLELELNRSPDRVDLIDVKFTGIDEFHATIDELQELSVNIELIRVEESLLSQLHNSFAPEYTANVMKG